MQQYTFSSCFWWTAQRNVWPDSTVLGLQSKQRGRSANMRKWDLNWNSIGCILTSAVEATICYFLGIHGTSLYYKIYLGNLDLDLSWRTFLVPRQNFAPSLKMGTRHKSLSRFRLWNWAAYSSVKRRRLTLQHGRRGDLFNFFNLQSGRHGDEQLPQVLHQEMSEPILQHHKSLT